MKPFYSSKLVILSILFLGLNMHLFAQPVSFTASGNYTYTVPSTVYFLSVDMAGAQGGTCTYSSSSAGGKGGRVQCVLAVTPGSVLNLYVGGVGAGNSASCCTVSFLPGGYNGGGGNYYYYGATGGGGTDIRIGGTALTNRVVVAGGGGGGGYYSGGGGDKGGEGGGLSGGNGYVYSNQNYSGICYNARGGTQTGGGLSGTCGGNQGNGSLGQGGNGTSVNNSGSSGGGGGYYGGAGSYYGGGAGGSSYISDPTVSSATTVSGFQSGDGYLKLAPLFPTVYSTNLTMDFGTLPVGSTSVPMFTVLSGSYLQSASGPVTIGCPSGYEVSPDGSTWSGPSDPPLTYSFSGTTLVNARLFVRFKPGAPTVYNNNLTVTGAGMTLPYNIPILGAGSAVGCNGTPSAGTAAVMPTSGGTGTYFTLGLSGVSIANGLFYQWQSSSSSSGPWTDIPGANRASFTFLGISVNTSFRCKVSCGLGTASFSTAATATYAASQTVPTCSGTPNPGRAYMLTKAGCSPYPDNFYVVGNSQDSGIIHQLQSSPDNISWTNVGGATGPGITKNITATIYYRDVVTCKISGLSSYGPADTAVLNSLPDPVLGITPLCSGYPSAYTSATPFGKWTSSNSAIAAVDTASGLVSGLAAGTATISYSLSTGCSSTATVVVNSSPAAITGVANVCSNGATTTLSNATAGGTWSSSDNTMATVAGGVVTGALAGNPVISYTLSGSGCFALKTVTVNQQPSAIGGNSSVCAGSGITLTNTKPGGVWSSTNSFWASVSPSTGFVSGNTGSTTPVITYTLPGGCFSTKSITVNSLPSPVTGSRIVCVGATTSLTDAGSGTWASSRTSVATVAGDGTVTGAANGVADIIYTLPATGCQTIASVTVNPLPNLFSVTGTGGYCFGTAGAHVGLNSSNAGVSYGLYNTTNPSAIIKTINGINSGLDFDLQISGTYKVLATDLTTGCATTMADSAVLSTLPLPAQYNVASSSGSYCLGGNGVKFTIDPSDPGINYEVHYGPANTLVRTTNGTGLANTDLGFYKTAGTYTVIGVNAVTGCSSMMLNSPLSVSIDTLPAVYPVTSSGNSVCTGGSGVHIQLPASDNDVAYYLLKNGIPVAGDTIVSAGGLVDFTNVGAAGTYTVKGYNAANCVSTMTNSIPLTVNTAPAVQTMNGGGAFCTGGAGVHVGLTYAVSGTKYLLYSVDSAKYVDSVSGANSGLDFGAKNKAGTYTVVAQSAAGCTSNMTGSKVIVENTLPAIGDVFGGGGYCTGSTGATIILNPNEAGISYRLFRNGTTPTLMATKTGTGTGPLTFGPYTATGTYSITAINPVTGCSNNMNGTQDISLNPLPTAYRVFAVGGGGYCANDTAQHIRLSGSQASVKYTLSLAGVSQGVYTGTGDSLDLGMHTAPGIYTVEARDMVTGCTQNILGTANISVNSLPAAYTVSVSGTGTYCAGGAGIHVMLSGSNTGINYQLYKDDAPTGITLGGVGRSLDFGALTDGGVYTVTALNNTTKCLDTMAGSGTVNVIALPPRYTVAPAAGKYCPGGTGVEVFLTNSVTGFNYKLYKGGVFVDSMVGGTSPLDFGNRLNGNYTIVAIDATYGCVQNMNGSADISSYASPVAYKVTGSGAFCPTTFAGAPVMLSKSDTGVKYELFDGGLTPIASVFGTRAALNFPNMAFGDYTIKATDTATTCNSIMTDTAKIVPMAFDTVDVAVVRKTPGKISVCASDSMLFTAIPKNGGTAPQYQWYVNHSGIIGSTNSTFTYTPTGKDTVTVLLGSNVACPAYATPAAYSNDTEGYITIMTAVLPSVSVTPKDVTVCKTSGPVAFNAIPVMGGVPVYQWKKNGAPVGTNSPSYSTTLDDSDVIFCVMLSTEECIATGHGPYVYSNSVVAKVTEEVTPSVTLLADPGTNVAKGTPVVFSAMVALAKDTAGLTYTYQWYRNGAIIKDATGGVYTTSDFNNNDGISCTVTSHNACGTASNTQQVFMTVSTLGVHDITSAAIENIQVVPNPNKGTFTIKGSLAAGSDEEVTLDVTDMLGQVVYRNKVTAHNGKVDQQVQLSNTLANGMYLLNFRTGADHKVFHFVIEQ